MSAPARFAACVLAAWASAAPAAAEPYVVCDNGLRCVRAPCPAKNVLNLASGSVLRVSGVDLARLDPRDRERMESANAAYSGSHVLDGAVVDTIVKVGGKPQPAPIFVATRVVRGATEPERRQCRGGE
jgi:hypothetical protein